jgi:predicted nucleotide-binding protein (sugar kinase/HSP70/actin superfamily)
MPAMGNIPVISISIMNTINEQPGFQPDVKKGAKSAIYAVLFADALGKMYYATAVREKVKGIAKQLREEYLTKAVEFVRQHKPTHLVGLMKEAAEAFNNAAVDRKAPRIGVVGEIFIKYNNYGQQHVVDWLVQHGIEPVIPALSEFFTQYFPNSKFNGKTNLEKNSFMTGFYRVLGETWMNHVSGKIDKAASAFRYYEPNDSIHEGAKEASQIVNLAAQFGEGWLIPAEFASFARRGIKAAISLQPFGCIANHVVAKGIEKRVKDLYPDLNLLYLDFDGGVSEVNVQNRLHFIARQVMRQE